MNKSTKSFFCEFLKKYNFPFSNIIDVGVGIQTKELRTNFKNIHQVLIEPQKKLIPNIQSQYKDNNYTLFDIGVSDKKGEEVDTLNNICRDFSKWLLLKIDVDGIEPKVLDGASEILEKCAFVIIEAQLGRFTEIYTKLINHNFELFGIVDPLYLEDCLWQVDLIFINNYIKNNHSSFNIGSLFKNGNKNFNCIDQI